MLEFGLLSAAANPDRAPDGDGRSNILELVFVTDQTIAGNADDTILSPIIDSLAQTTYLRNRTAAAAGVEYQLEKSTDVINWAPVDRVFSQNIDAE